MSTSISSSTFSNGDGGIARAVAGGGSGHHSSDPCLIASVGSCRSTRFPADAFELLLAFAVCSEASALLLCSMSSKLLSTANVGSGRSALLEASLSAVSMSSAAVLQLPSCTMTVPSVRVEASLRCESLRLSSPAEARPPLAWLRVSWNDTDFGIGRAAAGLSMLPPPAPLFGSTELPDTVCRARGLR